MSTVCRFSLITVKEFLHHCQPGVGRRSIMGTIWSTQLKNDLLRNIDLCTTTSMCTTINAGKKNRPRVYLTLQSCNDYIYSILFCIFNDLKDIHQKKRNRYPGVNLFPNTYGGKTQSKKKRVISRVFLLCQIWIVKYYVIYSVK